MGKSVKQDYIKKAEYPSINALKMHPLYRGKLQILPRCPISNYQDFSIWYFPGVAAPCKEINKHKEKVYDYTGKWNYVTVVSDGTRALGLGNIGLEASLPIMEAKALLFKYLSDVDAFPLTIGPNLSAEDLIKFVKLIQPTFGGINLEDISNPKCFKILDELRSDPEV
jgi:malate dehydrogenase (oxaloacetate-decarboxylating)